MSDSKWINRNLRAGSGPRGLPGAVPTFRREHSRRKSSRKLHMKSRRERRKINKKIGARIFFSAILLACVVIGFVVAFYSKIHRLTTGGTWSSAMISPFAEDDGLEPIAHNPSELVELFLTASTPGQLRGICRKDDNSLEILDQHADQILAWMDGHREWIPLHEAKANGLMFTVFGISHITDRPRAIYVVQTPDGPKVDIGAFLVWSSVDWRDLTEGKVTGAGIVRASANRVAYYNYRFDDESAYQSYRLDPHIEAPALYGYALRGSATAATLDQLVSDGHSFPVVVSLDKGEKGQNTRQFRISRVIAAGWATGPEIIEEHLPKLSADPGILAPINQTLPAVYFDQRDDDN